MSEAIVKPARVVTGAEERHNVVSTDAGRELMVTASKPNEVVTANHDLTEVFDLGDDVGLGLEGLRIEEQLTPFLAIIQASSPQVIRSKAQYIDIARPGMILNTVLGEVYDGDIGIPIIPVWREPVYTEWVPRNDYSLPDGQVIRGGGGDGGFRGVYSPDDPDVLAAIAETRRRFGKRFRFRPIPFRNLDTNEDTTLVQQFNLGVLYSINEPMNLDNIRRAMVAFTVTKIKVYQKFLAAAAEMKYKQPDGSYKPASLFAHRWRLQTAFQTNKKGDFFNWQMTLAEPGRTSASFIQRSDSLYRTAREFYDQWAAGQVKADYETGDGGAGDGDNASGEDDIPF